MNKIIILAVTLISCSNISISNFHKKYNYYINTLNNNEMLINEFSGFINLKKPDLPDRFTFVYPQLIDNWGYSEMALSYFVDDITYKKIHSKLCVINKYQIKTNSNKLKERYLNNNLMHFIENPNAIIPQLKYNSFYSNNINTENCELFILGYNEGLSINEKFLSLDQKQLLNEEHGYSYGVLLDDNNNQVIYWLIAW